MLFQRRGWACRQCCERSGRGRNPERIVDFRTVRERRMVGYTVPKVMRLLFRIRNVTRSSLPAMTGALLLSACFSCRSSAAFAGASPASDASGRTIACSSSVAPAPTLPTVHTTFVGGLPSPFGVAFSSDGHFVFVDSPPAASLPSGSELAVYAPTSSGRLVAKKTDHLPGTQMLGMSRSPDGRYVVAANQSGAQVFSA